MNIEQFPAEFLLFTQRISQGVVVFPVAYIPIYTKLKKKILLQGLLIDKLFQVFFWREKRKGGSKEILYSAIWKILF